jgi:ABC-type antimicrobial peptide transport system permease subunit
MKRCPIGIENPIGMQMTVWGNNGQVIGVVKDFHHQTLMHSIEPVVLLYNPEAVFMAFIGIETNKKPELILEIMEVYEQHEQEYPFQYTFIEDEYNSTYSEVMTIGRLANLFSIAAIFISCLGLFGLSAFITEQRTKETGIRKVLGASSFSLLKLFSGGFLKLVLLAFGLATPIAWWYATYWLADYSYRIDLGILPFVAAGLLAVLIALITVGYNTLRAANANPVDVLKDE